MHKLGHFGVCVTDYAKCFEFYTTYFNFFPSEVRRATLHPLSAHPQSLVHS